MTKAYGPPASVDEARSKAVCGEYAADPERKNRPGEPVIRCARPFVLVPSRRARLDHHESPAATEGGNRAAEPMSVSGPRNGQTEGFASAEPCGRYKKQ